MQSDADTQRCKGQRRIERRTLIATTWRNDYLLDWPEVRQVFRLTRERTVKGVTTTEIIYGISSLTRT